MGTRFISRKDRSCSLIAVLIFLSLYNKSRCDLDMHIISWKRVHASLAETGVLYLTAIDSQLILITWCKSLRQQFMASACETAMERTINGSIRGRYVLKMSVTKRCVKAILQGIRKRRGANNYCVIVLGTALRRNTLVLSYAALSLSLSVFYLQSFRRFIILTCTQLKI